MMSIALFCSLCVAALESFAERFGQYSSESKMD
jgi:hypothetical protein